MGKTAKGKIGVNGGKGQLFTRELTFRGSFAVYTWPQALSSQLPQCNAVSEPSWAQEPLVRGIAIYNNETMML